MNRLIRRVLVLFAILPPALFAQLPGGDGSSSSNFITAFAPADPGEGGGAGGQVEPAAYADRYLTRLALSGAISPLGTGVELATNLPYRIDLRVLGNYTNFDWKLTQTGFYIVVNVGMANAGAQVDYYPWKSLRISPGFLFYNANGLHGTAQAGSGASITLNNVTYNSDNADPVRGVGTVNLGGTGFMATTGWGHIVSRNEKHWHFPFEAGVALIDKPTVAFTLSGEVCTSQGFQCAPVTSYPGLENNLNAEVAKWNRRISPFHIYPIIKGGFSYTFRFRR